MKQVSTSLDAQINDYLLTASGHLKEAKRAGKGRQVAAFGAAASSALVMISQAEAAVVLNGGDLPPFAVVNGVGTDTLVFGAGYRLFDMDGDGNDDFAIWGYSGGNNGVAVAYGPYSGTNAMFGGGSQDLPKLSAGFTLGPAIPSASWTSSVMDTGNDIVGSGIGNPYGAGWTGGANERGFIGVSFRTTAGTHYGWICLQSNPTTGDASVSVVAYAYETTPDTAIQVGDTGSGTFACGDTVAAPLPAPAMGPLGTGLAALALGGVGLAGLRRRRETRQSDGSRA